MERDPHPLPTSLRAVLESVRAHAATGDLPAVETACRLRLRVRPYLLPERVALALCLSATDQTVAALLEWDEAIHQAERSADWEILAGCLAMMAGHHPREALTVLASLSGALPPVTRAWLKANMLADLGEATAAEETALAALATPWQAQAYVRERPPAYGSARLSARCDPGHQPGPDPLLTWIPDTGVSCALEGGTDGTEREQRTLDPLALRVG